MTGLVRESARILLHSVAARISGPKRYEGDATRICTTIVEACWNSEEEYFRTSLHNYPGFYCRDFGMCIDALLRLGHRERVKKTLAYALERYHRHGRVRQFITPSGKPTDLLGITSPDALAFLLYSLAASGEKELVHEYKEFLEAEIERLRTALLDKEGVVRKDLHLSGMRDYAIRRSSCYDNAMFAAMKKYADTLGLKNRLRMNHYKVVLDRFWTGSYFKDDLENEAMTGDANVAPLWFRIFPKKKEKELFMKIVGEVVRRRLDQPVVLRYEACRSGGTKMLWLDKLMGGWERDTAWLHLGNMYLHVAARYDRELAHRYLCEHRMVIEHYHHYPEVLTCEGKPFRTLFFHADDSMLWAANYLELVQRLEHLPRRAHRE